MKDKIEKIILLDPIKTDMSKTALNDANLNERRLPFKGFGFQRKLTAEPVTGLGYRALPHNSTEVVNTGLHEVFNINPEDSSYFRVVKCINEQRGDVKTVAYFDTTEFTIKEAIQSCVTLCKKYDCAFENKVISHVDKEEYVLPEKSRGINHEK